MPLYDTTDMVWEEEGVISDTFIMQLRFYDLSVNHHDAQDCARCRAGLVRRGLFALGSALAPRHHQCGALCHSLGQLRLTWQSICNIISTKEAAYAHDKLSA